MGHRCEEVLAKKIIMPYLILREPRIHPERTETGICFDSLIVSGNPPAQRTRHNQTHFLHIHVPRGRFGLRAEGQQYLRAEIKEVEAG